MNRLHECELREPVHQFFSIRNYSVHDEVRLFQRNIDIVAERRNKVVAVELKTRDWKRAVQQACLNLRVSDYSYVALPESMWSRVSPQVHYQAYDHGLGLLSVDGEAKQIMRPQQSERIQPSLRTLFLKRLREGAET
ncbi:hypothetical protein MUP59_03025 [Candidatus Bathyarchaeota archaeon]|nr:hypothetical protein [Candidatus Bathyarchaeota archaeon]